jgi:hypothetical protein
MPFPFRLPLRPTLALLFLIFLGNSACTNNWFNGQVWSEGAISVMGGATMATENSGIVAKNEKQVPHFFLFLQEWLHPIPDAVAGIGNCPPLNQAVCMPVLPDYPGPQSLVVFYDHCMFNTQKLAGFWRSYAGINLPSALQPCTTTMQGSDFTNPANITPLVSTAAFDSRPKLIRFYGLGSNSDQYNYRLGTNNEIVTVNTEFPSGYIDLINNATRQTKGGYQITFPTANSREIRIAGVHLIGRAANSNPTDASQFDALTSQLTSIIPSWDETLNTYYAGDTYSISQGSGEPILTETQERVLKVQGTGSTRTITDGVIRTQHNLKHGLSRTYIQTALVYSDPTCCYPTSGQIHTDFDPHYPRPWAWEEVQFTTTCGQVFYRQLQDATSSGPPEQVTAQLHHCF